MTEDWEEGYGVDLDNHGDDIKNFGSSWTNRNLQQHGQHQVETMMLQRVMIKSSQQVTKTLEIDVTTTVEEHYSNTSNQLWLYSKIS
jgi:hypothetical protein